MTAQAQTIIAQLLELLDEVAKDHHTPQYSAARLGAAIHLVRKLADPPKTVGEA